MKDKKITIQAKKSTTAGMGSLFEQSNYKLMLVGIGVLALGFLLMAGGKSNDPNVFNKNEVYGFVRITIAPIVIVAGLIIEIVAIFRNPKSSI